uniref:transcription initiation factor TFIID subunit 8 isoform X1 n=1 Tax=Myxine glutinosa TaxID=7769 RepID=UPI00359021EE
MVEASCFAVRPGRGGATAAENYFAARRRTLQVAASALLTEAGFEATEYAALETLTEMLQSYISEVGRSARALCEHTARTHPVPSDLLLCLSEMGFDVEALPAYAKRTHRIALSAPPTSHLPNTPKGLPTGQRRARPQYIPAHYPEFPDPHTYIRTPTYREPLTEYQVLRERSAAQRRDVERALTRFVAKTGPTYSLFDPDPAAFPLISCQPSANAYLSALLPSHLAEEAASLDNRDDDITTMGVSETGHGLESALSSGSLLPGMGANRLGEEPPIDNPYLRPVRKPKVRRRK